MYDLEQIRERVSLQALAEEAGAQFRNGSSRCPLHGGDNTSGFHLYDGGRRWHCFTRCSAPDNDGDVFNFYMRWKGVDFETAVEELGRLAAVAPAVTGERMVFAPPADAPTPPSERWQERAKQFVSYAEKELAKEGGRAARAYLYSERGLREETWRAFQLGYCPQDIYDTPLRWGLDGKKIWLPRGIVISGWSGGNLWYVKIRRPMGDRDEKGELTDALAQYIKPAVVLPEVKFGGARGNKATLFGSELRLGYPVALLVEGEWDAMLAWQEGHDFCDVMTLGGGKTRADLLDLAALACYPIIISVYDADETGDQAREYWLNAPGLGQRVSVAVPPDHDLSDFFRKGGNLRKWLARLVEGRMGEWMAGMDRERWGEAGERLDAVWQQLEEAVK
jgi:DNA primase